MHLSRTWEPLRHPLLAVRNNARLRQLALVSQFIQTVKPWFSHAGAITVAHWLAEHTVTLGAFEGFWILLCFTVLLLCKSCKSRFFIIGFVGHKKRRDCQPTAVIFRVLVYEHNIKNSAFKVIPALLVSQCTINWCKSKKYVAYVHN